MLGVLFCFVVVKTYQLSHDAYKPTVPQEELILSLTLYHIIFPCYRQVLLLLVLVVHAIHIVTGKHFRTRPVSRYLLGSCLLFNRCPRKCPRRWPLFNKYTKCTIKFLPKCLLKCLRWPLPKCRRWPLPKYNRISRWARLGGKPWWIVTAVGTTTVRRRGKSCTIE